MLKSMSNTRQHAHELIDRMPETQLSALVGLLETIVDPVAATLRNAPIEDEEISEEEERAVAESIEWLKHNKPIPHEQVLAEFGLTLDDFEMGHSPLPPEQNGAER
jgi:hypothetical protein